jgi:hypothetical protein
VGPPLLPRGAHHHHPGGYRIGKVIKMSTFGLFFLDKKPPILAPKESHARAIKRTRTRARDHAYTRYVHTYTYISFGLEQTHERLEVF